MAQPPRKPISELIAEAQKVEVGGYSLQHWRDGTWGTYFLESPSGEGTEIRAEALEAALKQLFEDHF